MTRARRAGGIGWHRKNLLRTRTRCRAWPDTTKRGRPSNRYPSLVIELMKFRLAPGTSEEEFLRADRSLQQDFAYQQQGLMRRTTARGENGTWIVIDIWSTPDAAQACAAKWDREPVTQRFMALLDRSSVQSERYMPLD